MAPTPFPRAGTRAPAAAAASSGRATPPRRALRGLMMGGALIALVACDQTAGFDIDMRRFGEGFSTAASAQSARTAPRPEPDARGVISYPSYQVVVADQGDTIAAIAGRLNLDATRLARYNGIPSDVGLRDGEVIALPSDQRVAATNASGVDIASVAGGALNRSGGSTGASGGVTTQTLGAAPAGSDASAPTGGEPVQHQVQRGETAYTIARQYGVSVRSLADWNGLDAGLTVREGQYLMIPVRVAEAPAPASDTTAPGSGSATPVPPSASEALPDQDARPLTEADTPASPEMSETQTQASQARMQMPVDGRIMRAFQRGRTDGIDISAAAGSPVSAAAAGTVAAITRDTDQVPILVIRHEGNLLSVYANIDDITVSRGDSVTRGQRIASVRAGDPSFLHFQVREGTQSVDPADYLN